jgi:hypothetical protein
MRSPRYPINREAPSPENLFSPAFLAIFRERDEVLTTSEAELSGPWKCEPVPGKPGAVAVLREWESVDLRDAPEAVVWHEERERKPQVADNKWLARSIDRHR